MPSTLHQSDDGRDFYFFPDDNDDGSPLQLVDGPQPRFVAAGRQLEVPFLFGICADQAARTLLYVWIERQCFTLIEGALLNQEWGKCSSIIDVLAESDFSQKILRGRRNKAP